jgi:hypothetical protein
LRLAVLLSAELFFTQGKIFMREIIFIVIGGRRFLNQRVFTLSRFVVHVSSAGGFRATNVVNFFSRRAFRFYSEQFFSPA